MSLNDASVLDYQVRSIFRFMSEVLATKSNSWTTGIDYGDTKYDAEARGFWLECLEASQEDRQLGELHMPLRLVVRKKHGSDLVRFPVLARQVQDDFKDTWNSTACIPKYEFSTPESATLVSDQWMVPVYPVGGSDVVTGRDAWQYLYEMRFFHYQPGLLFA